MIRKEIRLTTVATRNVEVRSVKHFMRSKMKMEEYMMRPTMP